MLQLVTTYSDQMNIGVWKVICWKNSMSIVDKPIPMIMPPAMKYPPFFTYFTKLTKVVRMMQDTAVSGKAKLKNHSPLVTIEI